MAPLLYLLLGITAGANMNTITTYLVLVFLTLVTSTLALAENEPLLAANTATAANPEVATEEIRFEQIREILSVSCFRCHSEAGGNRAGVNLETYENVLAHREGLQMHIEAGTMPPIRPLRLTDDQQTLVLNWLNQGAKP